MVVEGLDASRLLGVYFPRRLCFSGTALGTSPGIATSKLLLFVRLTDDSCSHFDNDAGQMTASNPRAGWEKVGDQFYRKIQLYESVFDPDLELENYLVVGAPYGGAIGRWQ